MALNLLIDNQNRNNAKDGRPPDVPRGREADYLVGSKGSGLTFKYMAAATIADTRATHPNFAAPV